MSEKHVPSHLYPMLIADMFLFSYEWHFLESFSQESRANLLLKQSFQPFDI